MDTAVVSDLFRDGVSLVIKIGGPILLLSMLVGVVVAIFQAVTQIHEQAINFALKLLVVGGVLIIGGGWMMEHLQDFIMEIFALIADIGK